MFSGPSFLCDDFVLKPFKPGRVLSVRSERREQRGAETELKKDSVEDVGFLAFRLV